MGAMYAKLVGSTGMWMEHDISRAVIIYLHYFILGMCLFAMLEVYFLTWPFVVVR